MKTFNRILSLVLVFAALFSSQLVTGVSAATKTLSYDCDDTVTMTVKTGSKAASMKLVCKAEKQTQTVNRAVFGKKTYTHTCSAAPKMAIKVSPSVGGKQYFYLQGSGKSISSTLKLDKNTTYTIEVSYYRSSCNLCKCNATNLNLFHPGEAVGSARYYCNGSWQVANSKNLNITNIRVR
ncbi:MAG: hypothetical protein E7461_07145 [Ruminococcaceae bacterium]|nr:hypothetical protein [Oscillospiraceae bacterium]